MKNHSRGLTRVLREHFGVESRISGAEIGVWKGENSVELLTTFPELILFMVDTWEVLPSDHPNERMARHTYVECVEARASAYLNVEEFGDRALIVPKPSPECASQFKDDYLDFVFIDADHSYESVRDDVAAWEKKVKPGGIVSGHDYNGRGDKTGKFGVKRAVDEFYGKDVVNTASGLVWWTVKQ